MIHSPAYLTAEMRDLEHQIGTEMTTLHKVAQDLADIFDGAGAVMLAHKMRAIFQDVHPLHTPAKATPNDTPEVA